MRYLICLILLLPLKTLGQSHWDQEDWDKEAIGFGCGYSASWTKPVHKMLLLLFDQNYDSIKQSLLSEKAYDQFLSAFVLEKLQKKKKLTLNEEELKHISSIHTSNKLVYVCAGCTYWNQVSLKELFDKKNKHQIFRIAESWFKVYSKQF